ncbi:lipid II:glycine glycyltransferase FemX [Demequina muriae]|uniref:Peptidoglycan bridge formation glycyltransferase FemA/FemB family protein n=1 Tax=Demequina muriae TaxID=3051664 RepID=A0ABT8GGB7_9MICO|nr:peptidoglycan bridge formation glycyltransferase FemA/FemB family protein [Demequina sp. EGI L300058]MDN4480478.1 peptidoglycan bridge formation glycyltransferase FemA/FemB family protein [Demequina sp. EGI L300058]
MSNRRPMRVEQVSDDRFLELASGSGEPVPIEQSPAWDPYDEAVSERAFWRRLAVLDGDEPVAVIALTEYTGRGFRYLWAKHGPVWIGEQTPEAERALRDALRAYIGAEAPHIVFVRLHARHPASDLHELLQTVTYDRTVVIDLTPEEDDIFASFAKRRRTGIRKALRDENFDLTDESGLSREAFGELYAIYEETAERDDFGIYEADTYYAMVAALGEHARVFVARRTDSGTDDAPAEPGRAVAWVIVTTYDGKATSYYAGANHEARGTNAVMLLRWHVMRVLKAEGVTQYDLMGVDSARAPQLKSVGDFKRQFADETEVDGAWDVAVKPLRYRALTLALRLKRLLKR